MNCKTKISYEGLRTGLLTWTADMDAWSFSLPAGKEGACPLAVYGQNSVCGTCYAQINRYNMPNVLKAQWVRFMWIKKGLLDPVGFANLHSTLVESIQQHVKNNFFRGHDSGDFFSYPYIYLWYLICRDLPQISFWFPTRSWQAKTTKWKVSFHLLMSLPNVSVRPSGLYVNQDLSLDGWHDSSTVIDSLENCPGQTKVCPKTTEGGSCTTNDCRSCWNKVGKVAYLVHGFLGQSKMANAQSEKIVSTRKKMSDYFVNVTVKGGSYGYSKSD